MIGWGADPTQEAGKGPGRLWHFLVFWPLLPFWPLLVSSPRHTRTMRYFRGSCETLYQYMTVLLIALMWTTGRSLLKAGAQFIR
jgi:hypothetical protein